MKALVLILALSFAAAAQTMVGLPEYSIELSGDSEAPVVTNHSGKSIIALAMRFELANGVDHTGGMTTFFHRGQFAPGDSHVFPGAYLEGKSPTTTKVIPGGLPANGLQFAVRQPVVRITIDSVAFADCQFVGPDADHSFDSLAWEIKDLRAMGQSVITGKRTLEDIAVLSQRPKPPHESGEHMRLRWVASEINDERVKSGEAQARDLARRYSELPDLWKGETK